MTAVRHVGEFDLIARWSQLVGRRSPQLVTGIGDDAAVIACNPDADTLVTTDMLVEGVHFRTDFATSEQLGWKSLAVSLSDVAAMGGTPTFAFISLGLPADTPLSFADGLYRGVERCAAEFGVTVAGGDTVSAPVIVINVALLGEAPVGRAALRSGARPGDALLVTGSLGNSPAGLRLLMAGRRDERFSICLAAHLTPMPRLAEARAAVATGAVHAMIDLSDGLSGDLRHICKAAGVGAVIDEAALPIDEECREAAVLLGLDPVDLALSGGEDYELLMAVAPDAASRVISAVAATGGARATCIGVIQPGDVTIRRATGCLAPLEPRGWEHFGRG